MIHNCAGCARPPTLVSTALDRICMSLIPPLRSRHGDPLTAYQVPYEATLPFHAPDRGSPALCYNLPAPDSAAGRDPEYAARLRALAANIGLSAGYVASVQ